MVGIWVVSSFALLWRMLLWTLRYKFGYLLRNGVGGSSVHSLGNIWGVVFRWLYHFTFPTSGVWISVASHLHLCLVCSVFLVSHSNRCEEFGFYPVGDWEPIHNRKVKIDATRSAGAKQRFEAPLQETVDSVWVCRVTTLGHWVVMGKPLSQQWPQYTFSLLTGKGGGKSIIWLLSFRKGN